MILIREILYKMEIRSEFRSARPTPALPSAMHSPDDSADITPNGASTQ